MQIVEALFLLLFRNNESLVKLTESKERRFPSRSLKDIHTKLERVTYNLEMIRNSTGKIAWPVKPSAVERVNEPRGTPWMEHLGWISRRPLPFLACFFRRVRGSVIVSGGGTIALSCT